MKAEIEQEAPEYCARHPDVETGLRCGNCDTLICPRCLVQTPVGARCPDCARLRAAPMYAVRPQHWALAFGSAIATGAALGVAWWFVVPGTFGLFFSVLIGAFMGWAMHRVVDWAAKGKRGPAIAGAAAVGLVLAYALRNALAYDALLVSGDLAGVIVVGVALVVAISQLRQS